MHTYAKDGQVELKKPMTYACMHLRACACGGEHAEQLPWCIVLLVICTVMVVVVVEIEGPGRAHPHG